jgi:GxxExxY protein
LNHNGTTTRRKADEMTSKSFDPIPDETEVVVEQILDGAFAVHRALGPGLLESVYEICLCRELAKRNLLFIRQLEIPIQYDGLRLESGLRIDLLVADRVVVELKATELHQSLFEAQLLTYLKLAERRMGLLINFNVPLLKDGIRRVVR